MTPPPEHAMTGREAHVIWCDIWALEEEGRWRNMNSYQHDCWNKVAAEIARRAAPPSTSPVDQGDEPSLRESPPFGVWQPMSSAPKDGRRILLFDRMCGGPVVAGWGWPTDHPERGRWEWVNELTIDNPLGWMPLPKPIERAAPIGAALDFILAGENPFDEPGTDDPITTEELEIVSTKVGRAPMTADPSDLPSDGSSPKPTPPAAIPETHVIVPREPTDAQLDAGFRAWGTSPPMPYIETPREKWQRAYRAMIAAAPSIPETHGGGK